MKRNATLMPPTPRSAAPAGDVTSRGGRTSALASLALAMPLFAALGCSEANPAYCTSHADCEAKAERGEIPQADRLCQENICFAGCDQDSDCQGASWVAGLHCDTSTRLCSKGNSSDDGGALDGSADQDGLTDAGAADGEALPDGGGLALGLRCEGPSDCQSRHCVDGVCCEQAACGNCEACNVQTFAGECHPVPDDNQPDAACLDASSGCQGRCDGQGGCLFNADDVCRQGCDSENGGHVLKYTCQPNGSCGESPNPALTLACNFSLCRQETDGSSASCSGNCATHADCLADSLCDRTELHANASGRGSCIDPARIVATVNSDTQLTEALDEAFAVLNSAPVPVIRLQTAAQANKLYKLPRDIPASKRLLLVADANDGDVVLQPDSGPGLKLSPGSALTLQGLVLRVAANGEGAIGILCQGAVGNQSTLTVVESTITGSQGVGIDAARCDVSLRRSTVQGNDGGGMSLANGSFTITNSVLRDNGTGDSAFGALNLSSPEAVVFVNNTVTENNAKDEIPAGVICPPGGITLRNSILAENNHGNVFACTLDDSTTSAETIAAACALDSARKPTAAPCLDGGDDGAAANLSVDHDGNARKQGAHVDRGAFEVQ